MSSNKEEIRKEYDFSKGVRGKHALELQDGHQTVIRKSNGDKSVRVSRPIILDPEVQEYFPDSKAVNYALRNLIDLVPEKRK